MRYSLREKSELLYEEHKFGGKQSEKDILGSLSQGMAGPGLGCANSEETRERINRSILALVFPTLSM